MNSYDSNPSTLTHPAFANEQLRGKRNRRAERGEEKGRDPQRRDGRSSGYLQVSARLGQGNMGPRPACKRKPAWGGNVQMQKAPGTPAPRTPPAESHSRSCTDAPAATRVTSHMQRFHPCHHMSAPQLESSAKVPQGTLRCCGVIAHFRHQT